MVNEVFTRLRAALFVTLLLLPGAAQAQDLALEAFAGSYAGTGVTNSRDAVTLGLVKRDLDVVISRDEDGFTVRWKTVVYQDHGTGVGPQVNRTSTEMRFLAGARTGIHHAPRHADPMSQSGYAWASISDRTLTINLLVVERETGLYDLHVYRRTLTDDDEMALEFTRIRSGRPRVIVQGTLARLSR